VLTYRQPPASELLRNRHTEHANLGQILDVLVGNGPVLLLLDLLIRGLNLPARANFYEPQQRLVDPIDSHRVVVKQCVLFFLSVAFNCQLQCIHRRYIAGRHSVFREIA
jgi:hypothetical protein